MTKVVAGILAVVAAAVTQTAFAAEAPVTVPPPGAVTWYYDCKVGDCKASCAVNGTELFQTGNFFGLLVMQLGDRRAWIRIDTGQSHVDFLQLTAIDKLQCNVSGPTVAQLIEPGKPLPAQ